jgi:hypothetical protein
LLLPVGHDGKSHVQSVFGFQTRRIFDRVKLAADAHDGEGADLQMEVGGVVTTSNSQKIVDFQGHEYPARRAPKSSTDLSKDLPGEY